MAICQVFFVGSITFEPWKRLWKSWAPGKFKTFVWLAIWNRCWTADRLQKKEAFHIRSAAHSVIRRKTVPHYTCVLARPFWCAILQPLNLTRLTPTRNVSFANWWEKKKQRGSRRNSTKRDLTLYAYYGSWTLWKHRNTCVFEGSAPNLQAAVQAFKDEAHVWQLAGAKGLSTLCLELGVSQV